MTKEGTTDGTLLGGGVRYRQPADGYRTGIEPVLLAAFVPARAGERVVEAGCGAGAGLLCITRRVAIGEGVGVERDPMLAALAHGNFAANGFAGLRADNASIEDWRPDRRDFDHALANPPWHDPAGTPSPFAARRGAKEGGAESVARWAAALGGVLRDGGTLGLILPASLLAAGVEGIRAAGFGRVTLHPLWPGAGRAARLVLLRGILGAHGADRLLPGLILHAEDGRFTPSAENVLRHGAPLDPPPGAAG